MVSALTNQSSCQCPSPEKFGAKTKFAIVLHLSDCNEPVVKIGPWWLFHCNFIRKLAIGKYWLGFPAVYLCSWATGARNSENRIMRNAPQIRAPFLNQRTGQHTVTCPPRGESYICLVPERLG